MAAKNKGDAPRRKKKLAADRPDGVSAQPAVLAAASRGLAAVPPIYTNQQLINALHDAAQALNQPEWSLFEQAGLTLEQLTANRQARYGGPPLEALPGLSAPALAQARTLLLDQLSTLPLGHGRVNAPDGLNLRAQPGIASPILSTLPHDSPVTILAELGEWLYALLEGPSERLDGYLYAAHVLRSAPASTWLDDDGPLALADPLPVQGSAAAQALIVPWNQYGALLLRLSATLQIDAGVALAVLLAESNGTPFGPDGRLTLRFEVHLFRREWNPSDPALFDRHFRFDPQQPTAGHSWRPSAHGNWQTFHGSQPAEWEVFTFARTLDERAALRSTSMGMAQIMGFNHLQIGYATVQEMFESFQQSERAQLLGFFRFLVSHSLLPSLQNADFLRFAAVYNGPGNAPTYAERIQRSLALYHQLYSPPPAAASPAAASPAAASPAAASSSFPAELEQIRRALRRLRWVHAALCGLVALLLLLAVAERLGRKLPKRRSTPAKTG